MGRRTKHAAVGVALAVLLTGCGAADELGAAQSVAPTAATPTTASPSPSASASTATPTPSVTPTARMLKVGDTHKDENVSVQVQKVRVNAKADFGLYSGALVKTCLRSLPPGEKATYFSWQPWALVDGDAGRYPDNGTSGGGLPTPVYPNGEQDGTFQPGDCAKGWMFFDVPKGTKIVQVRYQSGVMPEAATWALSD